MKRAILFSVILLFPVLVYSAELGYSTYSGTWEYKHYDYPATPSQSYTIATLAGTMPEDGEITSIHIMMKDDDTVSYEATFHAALYADNGSNFPSTRLALSGTTHYVTTTYTSYTEFVFPISYSATSSQKLWIGYDAISDDPTNYWKSSTWLRNIDTAPTVTTWIVYDRGVPNNLDDPFPTSPTPSSRTWAVNAWIEYTATATGQKKILMIQ